MDAHVLCSGGEESLAEREAETFAVARGDFKAAERSFRWALALAPKAGRPAAPR
jgi:hypothetical protein